MEKIGYYELDRLEHGISCITCQFAETGAEYVVVGTAYVANEELEPNRGRLLLFEVTPDHRVNLVSEVQANSGVYSMAAFSGKIAAGIGSKVNI